MIITNGLNQMDDKTRKYFDKHFSDKNITKVSIRNNVYGEPLLQVKFMENGTLKDKRILLSKIKPGRGQN
jgi:hypothetical protein